MPVRRPFTRPWSGRCPGCCCWTSCCRLTVLGKLRRGPETAGLPVILLTAKGTEYDKVVGLDAGADDYLPKPFGMLELVSRIKAVLRRTEPAAQEEYRVGSLYVCPARHIVRADGQEVKLALKEFELLCALLRSSGVVLTREQARELDAKGVNEVMLDLDGTQIKVFSNHMVDMKHFVDFDPAECGVTERLSETAQNNLCNIVTIFLGVSVGCKAKADTFLTLETVEIIILGLLAFCLSTVGGLLIGKLMCWATHGQVNPLIGSAGVSAVPMAARVSQVVGQKENPSNFLLMHAMGPNVAGVIGSAVAAGFMLKVFGA